mmetsp:Transcript_27372/g.33410  ORF Transcript_27372/g.33410 Transcript_27372/m.33410 type:complete len:605 (+) Transcript_27372:129-1943(+)|eukprot:CAMPEP_0204826634 /NCGR_PEP_ID=MMETSP1346-20131115/4277_1 /ASSEMBLY_ACC=CAM_ASM_000771 /TAXON_ID=215587 /ORGANISM="Aplanochytrium stocchinoi, Strain GSBS06" /LENGTH=604 /DNA_ID=CAMNT_0051954733 /DNA_START=62 /DNA_END=1876 /DNA_ORIENTATION=+
MQRNDVSSVGISAVSSSQKSFWQAITVGDLKTVKCLLETEDIDVNMYDMEGDQRKGGMSLHLAILEMPTWKGAENGGIQTDEYVRDFIQTLLDHGADIHKICNYMGEWYLQTGQGKTKSFFPNGYDSLGVVLQFIEITTGADVITNDVTKRLELIRDMLLAHKRYIKKKRRISDIYDSFEAAGSAPAGGGESSLNNDMKSMLLSGHYSDVTLKCEKNEKEFKCHKVVLAARSNVFDKMFSLPLSESREKVITIKEVHPDTLEAFLEYLYTDKVDERFLARTTNLLEFANRFDVERLKQYCCAVLCENLTVDNAASLLSFAHGRDCKELKDNILRFISENVKGVIDSEDFRSLDGDLMRAILKQVVHHPSISSCPSSFGYGPTLTSGPRSNKGKMSIIRRHARTLEEYMSRCRQETNTESTAGNGTTSIDESVNHRVSLFSALVGYPNADTGNTWTPSAEHQNQTITTRTSNSASSSGSGSYSRHIDASSSNSDTSQRGSTSNSNLHCPDHEHNNGNRTEQKSDAASLSMQPAVDQQLPRRTSDLTSSDIDGTNNGNLNSSSSTSRSITSYQEHEIGNRLSPLSTRSSNGISSVSAQNPRVKESK